MEFGFEFVVLWIEIVDCCEGFDMLFKLIKCDFESFVLLWVGCFNCSWVGNVLVYGYWVVRLDGVGFGCGVVIDCENEIELFIEIVVVEFVLVFGVEMFCFEILFC